MTAATTPPASLRDRLLRKLALAFRRRARSRIRGGVDSVLRAGTWSEA